MPDAICRGKATAQQWTLLWLVSPWGSQYKDLSDLDQKNTFTLCTEQFCKLQPS
jgi:hypothetical protein